MNSLRFVEWPSFLGRGLETIHLDFRDTRFSSEWRGTSDVVANMKNDAKTSNYTPGAVVEIDLPSGARLLASLLEVASNHARRAYPPKPEPDHPWWLEELRPGELDSNRGA